ADPLRKETLLECGQGVAREPRGHLLRRPVLARIRARVPGVSIRTAFEKCRTLAGAPAREGGCGRICDGDDVITVYRGSRDRVGGRPVHELLERRRAIDSRELTVEVVLADEHEGQPPDDREVQTFVKGPDVGGSVSEEGHRDLAPAR